MDTLIEEPKKPSFSFGIPLSDKPDTSNPLQDDKITSASVEAQVAEAIDPEKKKRGRKAGSTNKPKGESAPVPEYVKAMFGPLTVGIHNGLLKLLKLSAMDKEQEKSVIDGYAMLLHKRIPTIIENHGDIIAAVGATAYVFFAKIASETKLFEFGKQEKNINAEQHNNDTGKERLGQNNSL